MKKNSSFVIYNAIQPGWRLHIQRQRHYHHLYFICCMYVCVCVSVSVWRQTCRYLNNWSQTCYFQLYIQSMVLAYNDHSIWLLLLLINTFIMHASHHIYWNYIYYAISGSEQNAFFLYSKQIEPKINLWLYTNGFFSRLQSYKLQNIICSFMIVNMRE